MRIIGRFNSFNFTHDELKIPFHINENVGSLLQNIGGYLSEPLTIDFGDNLIAKGEIDSYSGKKKKITLTLLIKLPSGKGSEKFAKYVNVDPILIEIEVDNTVERPLERVDPGFLVKIKHTLGQLAREVNNTEEELIKLLLYAGDFGRMPISTQMYQVDAESFYYFMKEFIENKNIPVSVGDRYNVSKAYLKHCRSEMRCVVCGQRAVTEKGLYPVCKKHRDEFSIIKKDAFERKYKFKEVL